MVLSGQILKKRCLSPPIFHSGISVCLFSRWAASHYDTLSPVALWMCIPGLSFPFKLKQLWFYFCELPDCLSFDLWNIKVLLFNLMAANVTLLFLFAHLSFSFITTILIFYQFYFPYAGSNHCRMAGAGPGRKICTFSIFVLCTALLILNPTRYYLNPSIKESLQTFTLCVCK